MALVSYLITPAESPPRYGLDHEFAVDDEEFLPTMAGATGVPFLPGQPDRHPEQRRRVLSGDARRRSTRAEVSITIEAYIYWAGEIGLRVRRGAGGEGARRASGSRSCSMRSARRRSATRSSRSLEGGGCQLAWYNPIRWYTPRPLQPPHAPQVADRRRPHRVHRRRRHRRSLARATREDPGAVARHADPHRGAGGRCRCRPASRRTGCRRPAS